MIKTIGLIGGMSWESSLEYYRIMNTEVKKWLGHSHSCKSILYSVDFAEIEQMQHDGDWSALSMQMVDIAKRLEQSGADCLMICSNTMHSMADDVQRAIAIPLLHIADATAQAARAMGCSEVGLLGTRFTMEQPFYRNRLQSHGIAVQTPDEQDRERVHTMIYHELIRGDFREQSREVMQEIIANLAACGCEGIVLGCTEIPLLVQPEDSCLPLFNTTELHSVQAVAWALSS